MSGGVWQAGMGGEERLQRLLVIDTCGVEGSLALAEKGDAWRVVVAETLPGRSASERLLPSLRGMLEGMGWGMEELAAVAVVHGPGSFTGLRVGVSAAKGLCEASGVPLVAISRLAVLADGAVDVSGRVHAVLDAGRGEVFYGAYVGGQCEREDLLPVDAVLEVIAAEGGVVLVCEDGMEVAFGGAGARRVGEPTAVGALRLATERLQLGVFADIAMLDGNYLRRTDIEIRQRAEERERGRAGGAVG